MEQFRFYRGYKCQIKMSKEKKNLLNVFTSRGFQLAITVPGNVAMSRHAPKSAEMCIILTAQIRPKVEPDKV